MDDDAVSPDVFVAAQEQNRNQDDVADDAAGQPGHDGDVLDALEREDDVVFGMRNDTLKKIFSVASKPYLDVLAEHHQALRVRADKEFALQSGALDPDLRKLKESIEKLAFSDGATKARLLENLQEEQQARVEAAKERVDATGTLLREFQEAFGDSIKVQLAKFPHLIISEQGRDTIVRMYRRWTDKAVERATQQESERVIKRLEWQQRNRDALERDTAQSAADMLDAPTTVNALIAKQVTAMERNLRDFIASELRKNTLAPSRARSNSRAETPRTQASSSSDDERGSHASKKKRKRQRRQQGQQQQQQGQPQQQQQQQYQQQQQQFQPTAWQRHSAWQQQPRQQPGQQQQRQQSWQQQQRPHQPQQQQQQQQQQNQQQQQQQQHGMQRQQQQQQQRQEQSGAQQQHGGWQQVSNHRSSRPRTFGEFLPPAPSVSPVAGRTRQQMSARAANDNRYGPLDQGNAMGGQLGRRN